MGRTKKNVEVPGQEKSSQAEEARLLNSVAGNAVNAPRADNQTIQQLAEGVTDAQNTTEPTPDPESSALEARNAVLATINEQGAAIIARFEDYAFTDLVGNPLTNCIDFLVLVKKATTAEPAAPLGYVTNDEGKRQPVTGKPVLTEHGWHVPG
ncbi:TPA: hypothetical protein N2N01_000107 [Citrobacter freundii]|nr:hypothetical protein [Citrobacter freundii]